MKRKISCMLALSIFLSSQMVFAEEVFTEKIQNKFFVDNEATQISVNITEIDGLVYCSVKDVAKILGGNVSWNKEKNTIDIKLTNYVYSLKKNSNIVEILNIENNSIEKKVVKDSPIITEGTTFVTPRFVQEIFNVSIHKYKDGIFIYTSGTSNILELLESASIYDEQQGVVKVDTEVKEVAIVSEQK